MLQMMPLLYSQELLPTSEVVRPCVRCDGFAHHPRNDQLAKEYDQNVILLN